MSYIKVKLWGQEGIIKEYEALKGRSPSLTTKIPLEGVINIELVDGNTLLAPQVVILKRQGNNLALALDGDNINYPDILLENFYDRAETHLVGEAQDGLYYEFVPTTGEVQDYTPLLTEGAVTELALGGSGSPEAAPPPDGNSGYEGGFSWLPYVAWVAAAGAAIGIVSLLKGHSDDHKSSPASPEEPSGKTSKGQEEASQGQGEISGGSNAPDSVVTIELPDGTLITTETDARGDWRIDAPSAQPDGKILVTVTTEDGQATTVSGDYKETTAPDSSAVKHQAELSLPDEIGPLLKSLLTEINPVPEKIYQPTKSVEPVKAAETENAGEASSTDHAFVITPAASDSKEGVKGASHEYSLLAEGKTDAAGKEDISQNKDSEHQDFPLAELLDAEPDGLSVEAILQMAGDNGNTASSSVPAESLHTDPAALYAICHSPEVAVIETEIQHELHTF